MSVGTKVSDTTTCASETDDGDYETSSEGHIRFPRGPGVIDPAELGSKYDGIDPRSDEEESSKISSRKSVLIKSESMPVLQKVSSNEEGQVVQTSESSLACQRKIKVIVAKMAPLLSPWSSLSLATSVTSKADLNDEGYVARKMESRTQLPVLEVI
ncbi:uncharacterized protein LOC143359088 [Halictus rubicundus]|uniref:uncharacterized protein LOC143359088 n=1 Tax=Halictus rubicundus TaxID=77578 RepID=UPI004036E29B